MALAPSTVDCPYCFASKSTITTDFLPAVPAAAPASEERSTRRTMPLGWVLNE